MPGGGDEGGDVEADDLGELDPDVGDEDAGHDAEVDADAAEIGDRHAVDFAGVWSVDDAVGDGEASEEGDRQDGDEEGGDEDGEVAVEHLEPCLLRGPAEADEAEQLVLLGGEGLDLVAERLDSVGDARWDNAGCGVGCGVGGGEGGHLAAPGEYSARSVSLRSASRRMSSARSAMVRSSGVLGSKPMAERTRERSGRRRLRSS